MRLEPRAIGCLVLLGALGSAWGAGLAQAPSEEPEAYEDGYQAGDYGRVRYHENGLTLSRSAPDAAGDEIATGINAPVFPGDTMRTAGDQRVEIQLAGGSLVRIDRNSELTFLALPDPSADHADNTVVQLAGGAARLTVSLERSEEFRIDTPASSIYLLGDADLRVEVDGRGTRVQSRRGVAEVVGSGGSILVRGGMQVDVRTGSTPQDPTPFDTFVSDGFDRWVDQRQASYAVRDRYAGSGAEVYRALPDEVRPYYGELSSHGSWTHVEDYGYVWCPRGVAADWRPYLHGSWSYGPGGYFWVSNDPWGWAPYHYGRWSWSSGIGWCWIPGRVFSGAWVSWSWGPTHVGWCPLDYWNRPVFVSAVHHHYYDPHAWTFVSYAHVGARDCARHAVPAEHIGQDLNRAAVGTRAPRIAPSRLATSVEARQSAVRGVRGRVSPPARERADVRPFERVEDRIPQRPQPRTASGGRERARGGAVLADPPDRDPRAPTPGRPGTPPRADRRGEIERPPVSRYPRRLSAPGTEPRRLVPGRPAEAGTVPPPRPADDTSERVRGIYRRMAQPRETQPEQPARPAPPREDAGTVVPPPRPPAREPVRPAPPPERRSARPSAPRESQPREREKQPAPPATSERPPRREQPPAARPAAPRQPRPAAPEPAPRPRRERKR